MDPNIYHAIVFDMHRKVREFLDALDQEGQIDRDETNMPHVVSIDTPQPSVFRCVFSRNGRPENFLIHTRKKVEPVRSWGDDGWIRPERLEPEEVIIARKERDRRSFNAFEHIMEQILPRGKRR